MPTLNLSLPSSSPSHTQGHGYPRSHPHPHNHTRSYYYKLPHIHSYTLIYTNQPTSKHAHECSHCMHAHARSCTLANAYLMKCKLVIAESCKTKLKQKKNTFINFRSILKDRGDNFVVKISTSVSLFSLWCFKLMSSLKHLHFYFTSSCSPPNNLLQASSSSSLQIPNTSIPVPSLYKPVHSEDDDYDS